MLEKFLRTQMTRREFLKWLFTGGVVTLLASLRGSNYENENIWPTDPESILKRTKELELTPGSQLETTLCLRKIAYEESELLKMQGLWTGDQDQSDWLGQLNRIEEDIAMLAEVGFKSVRLVIFPFELTEDGETYNWKPLDTALGLTEKHGIKASVCVGPFKFPYDPGVRLPIKLRDALEKEFADRGQTHIHISLDKDPNMPESSVILRDYGLKFLQKIGEKYKDDQRIENFFVDNEPPDKNKIEGLEGKELRIGADFLFKVVEKIASLTNKKIAFNTNIHPSNLRRMRKVFGSLLEMLGERAFLGIDAYPTREGFWQRVFYGESMRRLKQAFPQAEIGFTEFQGELYDDDISGKPWAEIVRDHLDDRIKPYFQTLMPPTLESYLEASELKRIGIWGAPLWIITQRMGYKFPLELMKALSDAGAKANESKKHYKKIHNK